MKIHQIIEEKIDFRNLLEKYKKITKEKVI
jgi:hypothetical protein